YLALMAALDSQERYDEAWRMSADAIQRFPQSREAHIHHAYALLRQGGYMTGFAEYADWLYADPTFAHRQGVPRWHWTDRPGKVAVWCPEGFGDFFMIARYFSQMAERGCQVQVVCWPPLARIARDWPGVSEVLLREEGKTLDVECLAIGWRLASYY